MPLIGISLLLVTVSCKKPEGTTAVENANSTPPNAASPSITADKIVERYRALDTARDSIVKMRAEIVASENVVEMNAPRHIQLTVYRKRQPDGRLLMLVEFTAPGEERDRDGLITVFPDGRIEAVRYVQSTDSFIVSSDPTSEDALFGLTTQELADGQVDKYDFSLAGEETHDGTPVFRLNGALKQAAESKFSRVVLLISKQDFTALEAEFYDNHQELARRVTVSKFEQIAGHWTRTRWTIDNRARQKRIVFEAVDVKYDQDLSDSVFTRDHLKKIAAR
ncbi:MAG: outer membrane lipoprotein-sorting protein [Blastocatellia bacterium]